MKLAQLVVTLSPHSRNTSISLNGFNLTNYITRIEISQSAMETPEVKLVLTPMMEVRLLGEVVASLVHQSLRHHNDQNPGHEVHLDTPRDSASGD